MGGHGGLGGVKRNWGVGLALLLGLCVAGQVVQGQEGPPTITVTVNQSRVMRLEQKAKRVSVTQSEIAEVVVVAPNQILLNGKTIGTTSLVVWDERGAITNFNLIVVADIGSLQRQLKTLFPEEKIDVSASGASIVLKGEVSNEVIYDKVLEVTQTYLPPAQAAAVAAPAGPSVSITSPSPVLPPTGTAFAGGGQIAFVEEPNLTDVDRWGEKRGKPGIIDLLVINEFRQIQLNVIVAEVSLTRLRELGFDFSVIGTNTTFVSHAGSQGIGDVSSALLSHVSSDLALTTLYHLLQNKDITEILARPNLVIKNGRPGGFLAGGEFPFPVASGGGLGVQTVTIEFKPFGVRLDFIPTLTWSNSIDLRVFPEVSEIDPSVQSLVSGFTVPGLRVRRSVSRVEMKEGETLVISGLLDHRTFKDLTKFPFLGDIPILGMLFRTTRFRNQDTELIFVITPQIVKALPPGQKPALPSPQKYDDPDIRQVPLPTPPPPAPEAAPSTTRQAPAAAASEPASDGGPTIP